MITEATMLFLDAYLKGDAEAKRLLRAEELEKSSGGEIIQEDKSQGSAKPAQTREPETRTAVPPPPALSPEASPGERVGRLIRAFDRDGDSRLSRDEIPETAERLRRAFDHIDADHDGRLSRDELERMFNQLQSRSGGAANARGGPSASVAGPSSPAASKKSPPVVALTPGAHPVKIAEVDLHDTGGGKRLPVRVAYPEAEGRYPVIVFSHSLGRSKNSYDGLVRYWASHGYVCVLPDHADSPNVGGGGRDPQATGGGLSQRARDLVFVLDSISAIGDAIPELRARIDPNRVGVGGHYVGAFASSLLAGARWDASAGDGNVELRDPRIQAVVWLSPQGTGQGMTRTSWAAVSVPVLTVTGSADVSPRTGNRAEWRMEPYQFSSPGDKYLVFIDGYPGPREARGAEIPYDQVIGEANQSYVYRSTLDFWGAYLKQDAAARARLQAGELEKLSGGVAKVSHR
jgi:dienelactone hydrolase